MQQDNEFDQPWWSIEILLKWIGKGEEEGLAEIRKNESRLGLTGKRGRWYGTQNPRSSISDLEFLDCVLEKADGRYVYHCSRDFRGTPTAIWENLRLQATNAKAVWPKKASDRQPAHRSRRRGPKEKVGPRVFAAMLSDIQSKRLTREELDALTEEALAEQYEASRDTVRKARKEVLSRTSDN